MVKEYYRAHEILSTSPEEQAGYIRDYRDKKNDLITAAALDRDNAVSYRDFKVGSAIMSKEPNQAPGEYSLYSGHNYKPAPAEQEGVAKRCAEKMALEQALANHTKFIPAIVSVSDRISTGTDSAAHDALHPCEECRVMIRQLKKDGLLSGESIICNVNDSRLGASGQWAEEERTVDQLLSLYPEELDEPLAA